MHSNGSTSLRRQRQVANGAVTSAGTVMRAVLEHGPVARSTIARRTGLSPASVTGYSAKLAQLGLIRELPVASGPKGMGRPHVPVDVDAANHVVLGMHIAVSHATLALLDLRGEVLAMHREPHGGARPRRVLERGAELLLDMLDEHAPRGTPLGIGVASGGWVDRESGTLIEHPLLNWHNVPVRDLLVERTGLAVQVDGHSRALAHAELLFGKAKSRSGFVHLFVGNVVDAAFAFDGSVHYGPRSSAGAVAHLPVAGGAEPCTCGREGCLQAEVSERTLAERAVQAGVITDPVFADLLRVAECGDPAALELFLDRSRLVGRAAAVLMDLLNPEVLIVVDQGLSTLPKCLPALRSEVRKRSATSRDVERSVLPTSFPGTVLATAAGSVLLDELYSDPLGPLAHQMTHAS